MEIAFGKKNLRKTWMREYDPTVEIAYESTTIKCSNFIDNQMRQFAVYSTSRAIPHIMDGLKLVQRKIIWGIKKINPRHSQKVAALTGKIMALSHYKHGPASMNGAMSLMAQDFTGSNNYENSSYCYCIAN